MCISPNGQYFFSGGKEGVIVFWNLLNETKKFMPRLNSEIASISVSQNSSILAVVLKENKIKFIKYYKVYLVYSIIQ
jgi:NET1-associated nuclear protein 1 (U3 small nucleolar RNA-associated protein 17)